MKNDSTTAAARKKKPYDFRRFMFDAHLYLGLAFGLFMLVTGVTGSLIVFRAETDVALNAGVMTVAAQSAPVVSPELARASAAAAFPDAELRNLHFPTPGRNSFEAVLKTKTGGDVHAYFNPYTGARLGSVVKKRTLTHWITELHVSFFAGKPGETAVGALGVFLAVVGLSGLVLWLPKKGQAWRNGFSVKWKSGWKRVNFDLHRVGGFFAFALLTLTALTGAAMAFGKPVETFINRITGSAPPAPRPEVPPGPPLPLDRLVAAAETALPGGVATKIHFPRKPGESLVVRKRMPGEWRAAGHTQIHLDPATGTIARVEDARRAPLGRRIWWSLYELHVGEYGGIIGRLLQVVVGLTPGGLFVGGFLMWRNRVWLKGRKPARRPVAVQPAGGRLTEA